MFMEEKKKGMMDNVVIITMVRKMGERNQQYCVNVEEIEKRQVKDE